MYSEFDPFTEDIRKNMCSLYSFPAERQEKVREEAYVIQKIRKYVCLFHSFPAERQERVRGKAHVIEKI